MLSNGKWEGDLIEDFCEYTGTQRTAQCFREWAGISLVAGALGRRLWIDTDVGQTFGNLYVFLVAPPGRGKGVIRVVGDLWSSTADPHGTEKPFKVARDNVTKAALIDEMDDAKSAHHIGLPEPFRYQTLLVPSAEFESLLPDYDSAFISTLNTIFDNPPKYEERRRTGTQKKVELTNPQLNILAAVQPAYFVMHFPQGAWDTGLVRRIIMIYNDQMEPWRSRQPTEREQRIKMHLHGSILKRLGEIFEMYGPVAMAPGAWEVLDNWEMEGAKPVPSHPKLQHYNTTRGEFVVKLSLISAISRTGQKQVDKQDVERAIRWLLEAEERMPDVYSAMKGESDQLVLYNLHQAMWAWYVQNNRNPIPVSKLFTWLRDNSTSQKVQNLIFVAEGSGLLEFVDGRATFQPLHHDWE